MSENTTVVHHQKEFIVSINVQPNFLEGLFGVKGVIGLQTSSGLVVDLAVPRNSPERKDLANQTTVLLFACPSPSSPSPAPAPSLWREFPFAHPSQLTPSELSGLRELLRQGADWKLILTEGTQMVLPIVRAISQASEHTVWMYCMREGNFTLGFALSTQGSAEYHGECWLGKPVEVSSFDNFVGGTSGNIVGRRKMLFRLLYKL
eukprot:TRINITY_DN16670_c0_g1_i1.p1 TRINITY_DN16670_c0_g1~~TRINITY_DN16670_c0_g1_i1.p1  ORF type:complete len:205 (+),score=26.75 TRINITY_DN16670_c0_g1_i1:29-643(+)